MPLRPHPPSTCRSLAVAALLTCVTGIASGVFPALRASADVAFDALREGVRGGGGRGAAPPFGAGRRSRSRRVSRCSLWAGLLLMRAATGSDGYGPGFPVPRAC